MDSLVTLGLLTLPSAPITVLYLIGIIMAATKMHLYRRAAVLALVGFVLLLLSGLSRIGVAMMTLPDSLGAHSRSEIAGHIALLNLGTALLTLVGMILLLLAIFADRDKKPVQ
jgi:hypothetical protein